MTFSKRTVQNLDFPFAREYFGIDLEKWARSVPDHAQSPGKYVMKWAGAGTRQDLSGVLTIDAALSTSYVFSNGDRWAATDPRLVFDYSGSGGGISMQWASAPATGLQMYRLADETDLLAGKVYRRAALQLIVDQHPSAIRFLNWLDVNNASLIRWENRALPTDTFYVPNFFTNANSGMLPSYGSTSGTNQMTLSAIGSTPGSMQHGEVVQCTITNDIVRSGAKTVTAITKANPGVVSCTAHGFNTGDKIVHSIASGMTQLDRVACTITVSDANTYSIGINTTGYTTFTSGNANQNITLNVGTRGEFPVVFGDGGTPASNYGNAYIAAADKKAFVFDKRLVANIGVTGAWIFNNLGNRNYYSVGVPMEICVAFMNELNDLCVAQGKAPIDMWMSVPHCGMLSGDDDYSSGSNVAVGMVDVALNGANGWDGLRHNAGIFAEFSNELWNFAFGHSAYCAWMAYLRWGVSRTDFANWQTLRSCQMAHDIKAAFPGNSRLKFVIAGQGTGGVSGNNDIRINGSATLDGDATFISIGGGDPIDYHDAFSGATYFTINGGSYESSNLATLAANYAAATTDDDREAQCTLYAEQLYTGGASSETVAYYVGVMQTCAAAMVAKGKVYVNYEGGWDRDPTTGSAAVQTFLHAVKRSRAWSAVTRRYLAAVKATAGAYMPAVPYQAFANERWGDAYPDSWANQVEGGNLAECWQQVKQYNNAKRRLYVGWGS